MVGMSRLPAENASHHDTLTDLRAGSASITKTSLREVTPRQPADQPGEPLTKREHEVLKLVAQGLTDHGIAERDSSAPPGPPPDDGAAAGQGYRSHPEWSDGMAFPMAVKHTPGPEREAHRSQDTSPTRRLECGPANPTRFVSGGR